MRDDVVGRLFRIVRIRHGWRQEDVAAKCRLDRSTIGRIECGEIDRFHVATLRRHATALGFRLEMSVTGRGGEAAQLLDEEHAAIVECVAAELTASGWIPEPEASFSEFGERGRVDVLAHDPRSGELLVVEVKTELVDLQQLFGSLNIKSRLAQRVASHRGWHVRSVSVMLALANTTAIRAIVAKHPTLFGAYTVRSRGIGSWLADPTQAARLLWFVPPAQVGRSSWIAGRRRISRS